MARKNEQKRISGFLSRLRHDQAGNVIAIVGASVIPMLAIIGGTVDMSRGYMVKVRLQQACDAGALAGRHAVGEGVYDANAESRARAMFKSNFPEGYQGASETEFDPSSADQGITVTGTATTKLPTVIMGLFKDDTTLKGLKKQSMDLTVNCNAKMEVNNSDIMMVLDTTGSMACPNDSNLADCTSYFGTYGAVENQTGKQSRMASLKTATKNFAAILNGAADGTNPSSAQKPRVRFGFVPYTHTVNTGKLLYAANPSYILGGNPDESWNYNTRRPVYKYNVTTTVVVPGTPAIPGTPEIPGEVTPSVQTLQFGTYTDSVVREYFCNQFAANAATVGGYGKTGSGSWTESFRYPADYGYSGSGQNVTKTGDPGAKYTFSFKEWGPSSPSYNVTYSRKSCKRNVIRTGPATAAIPGIPATPPTTTEVTTTYETFDKTVSGTWFDRYEYATLSWPVSAYVASANPANSPVPDKFTENGANHRWAGCIEERQTTPAAAFAYDVDAGKIAPNAQDMDIDAEPTSDQTSKWKPYWPEATWQRAGNYTQKSCVQEAKLLTKLNNTKFGEYIDALIPDGGTFHDIGTLWGARLSSPDGIFSENVLETPVNSGYVSRHMIIMTDGEQSNSSNSLYTAYGLEGLDGRITGGDLTVGKARHISRFRAICEAVKAKGIRVWFVAFGTTLNTDMTACASPNSSFTSSDATQLNDAFVEIAQNIAELRLAQ
jgi:Flp pilus assembly protein TadG